MARATPKTQRTGASVARFIASVADETRRRDARALDRIFREITGEAPVMWGAAIIGYGSYEGKTGTWMRTGFSPRKTSLVLYVMPGFAGSAGVLAKLGKHRTGKACLYVGRLADVNEAVLRDLVARSWAHMGKTYGEALPSTV